MPALIMQMCQVHPVQLTTAAGQARHGFAPEQGGTAAVALPPVDHGNGNLHQGLKGRAARFQALLPEGLQGVMAGVPVFLGKEGQRRGKSRIRTGAHGLQGEGALALYSPAAGQLAQPNGFRGHLQQLTGADVTQGPFQGHVHGSLQRVQLFRAR